MSDYDVDYEGIAEKILETVDYDIYKEDLEERGILSDIEAILVELVGSLNNL